MAHIAHFTAGATGQLRAHIDRTRGDRAKYGNEEIDPKKSHLNFHPVGEVDGDKAIKVFSEYAENIGQHRKKTDNVMTSVIVHLPERYLGKPKEWQDEFFTNVHKFLSKQFECDLITDGKAVCSNLIASTVHYDETTPHIHFAFVPVVKKDFERKYKDRNGKERTTMVKAGSISSRYVVTKPVLQRFHPELDKYLLKEQKGYKGGILLDKDEKIEKALMLDAKDLKKAPKDYLEQARKISKGLRLMKATKELEEKRKELERDVKHFSVAKESVDQKESRLLAKEVDLEYREKQLYPKLQRAEELEERYNGLKAERDELQDRLTCMVPRQDYNRLQDKLKASETHSNYLQTELDTGAYGVFKFISSLPQETIDIINDNVSQSKYGNDFLNTYNQGKEIAKSMKPKKPRITYDINKGMER